MKAMMIPLLLAMGLGAQAEIRTWTLDSGRQVDAEYDKVVMDLVWLKDPGGEVAKVPLTRLSENDRLYIELLNPPKLDIEFHSKEDQLLGYYKATPYLPDVIPPDVSQCTFETVVRKKGTADYHHDLKVEYYAIGRQRLDRDKYILLEKETGSYAPFEKPEFKISGGKVRLLSYVFNSHNRGGDFAHYLVVVTDQRGHIVAHKESAKWLFEHLDRLEKLPVGAYMDDTCTRVHPTGPKPTY